MAMFSDTVLIPKTNRRFFVIRSGGDIVDKLNPASIPVEHYWHAAAPDFSDRTLRMGVFGSRMLDLLARHYPATTDEDARDDVMISMSEVLGASELDAVDVRSSIEQRFTGRLRRKSGKCSFLLGVLADVECLLRDLYGDLDCPSIDAVLQKFRRILVQSFPESE
jgi:hypothetical protein